MGKPTNDPKSVRGRKHFGRLRSHTAPLELTRPKRVVVTQTISSPPGCEDVRLGGNNIRYSVGSLQRSPGVQQLRYHVQHPGIHGFVVPHVCKDLHLHELVRGNNADNPISLRLFTVISLQRHQPYPVQRNVRQVPQSLPSASLLR